MKNKKRLLTGIISAAAMFLLILDSKTTLTGAKEGITLCLYTVIPSLFPFMIISCLFSSISVGVKSPILRPLGRLCGIPDGAESLLIIGLVGGYPVGAQNIFQAYRSGKITKEDAHRMLGFCNNAGPAFVFGLLSALFPSPATPWVLWLIHIISALIVGYILPDKSARDCQLSQSEPVTVIKAVEQSAKTMVGICSWIIVFRIFLAVLQRWLFWILPKEITVVIFGFMELSNGCIELFRLNSITARFVLSTVFLSFGGICVTMQTLSVIKGLGSGMYFPGKILQTFISFLLACIAHPLIFPTEADIRIPFSIIISTVFFCFGLTIWMYRRKKVLAFPSIV